MRVDGDGVEDHLPCSSLHVKRVQQILHADIVRGESGRIVLRETRRRARDGSGRIPVGRGVNQDDPVGVLQRLQQNEAAGAAVETFDIRPAASCFASARTTCTPTPSSPMMTLPRPSTSVF